MSPKTNQGVVDVPVETGREYGGADMVEVYVYRKDGVRYIIRTTAGNAKREKLELVNPPKPKAKARKPADKSRTKATADDKAKTPKATKSSTSKPK